MSFKDTNVLVCGARNYLDGHTLYTTVIPKPIMDDNRIVLTQDMMSKKNTKYIIKWNFVLGEDITVPKNCLIEFDGGSISNDNGENFSLTGQDTYLLFDLTIEEVLAVPLLGTFIYGADKDKLDNTDGMAKIYLKSDKSFAEQVDTHLGGRPNTIYVIRYDFTLDDDVTLPANCVLEFDGGSISASGSIGQDIYIIGQNTYIEAGLVKIFGTDVKTSGTWIVDEIYPEWFGAISSPNGYMVNQDIIDKNNIAFAKIMDFSVDCRNHHNSYNILSMQNININFAYGTYYISDYIQIPAGASLNANSLGTIIYQTDNTKDIFVCDNNSYLWGSSGSGAHQCTIKGFTFVGGKKQIILVNSNITGYNKIIECNFINSSDKSIYIDTVSTKAVINNCRVSTKEFLYAKCDLINIDGLEGAFNLPNDNNSLYDYAFIVNKSRCLKLTNALITIDSNSISMHGKKSRIIDNYWSVIVDNFIMDCPTGGIPVVYNYSRHTPSDWGNYNNENYDFDWDVKKYYWVSFGCSVVIKNSHIPSDPETGVIVLAGGVPSITSIRCCSLINGKYISVDSGFDIVSYLNDYKNKGTISINIQNNNAMVDLYVPDELLEYTNIDYDGLYERRKDYIPSVLSNIVEGKKPNTTISSDGTTFVFDFDIMASNVCPSLVSIYGYNWAEYGTRLTMIYLLKTRRNAGISVETELEELCSYTQPEAPVHNVSVVWVYDGSEHSYVTSDKLEVAHLRIKVDNYGGQSTAAITGNPKLLQCRMLGLVPDFDDL